MSNYTIRRGWIRWHVYRLNKRIGSHWFKGDAEDWVKERERIDAAHRVDTYAYAKYNQQGPHSKPTFPSPDWRDDSMPGLPEPRSFPPMPAIRPARQDSDTRRRKTDDELPSYGGSE